MIATSSVLLTGATSIEPGSPSKRVFRGCQGVSQCLLFWYMFQLTATDLSSTLLWTSRSRPNERPKANGSFATLTVTDASLEASHEVAGWSFASCALGEAVSRKPHELISAHLLTLHSRRTLPRTCAYFSTTHRPLKAQQRSQPTLQVRPVHRRRAWTYLPRRSLTSFLQASLSVLKSYLG